MLYGNYDEKSDFSGFGYPPPEADGGDTEARFMPDSNDRGAPAGAPAVRTDAPVPETIATVHRKQSIYNPEHVVAPLSEEWRDPIYRQTNETLSNMYTPGIYTNQPYSRRRGNEAEQKQKTREGSGWGSRFLRAVCLAIVCVALSGAAAYGMTELRLRDQDNSIVVNPVVLGGSSERQDSGELSTKPSASGSGMPAEDIYTMACTQVVGISTIADASNSIFGGSAQGSTTAVAGSGFIISGDGYILTNHHVIQSAYDYNLPLVVCLNDGTEFEAKIIGYETDNDVAVIKIAASGLNPVVFADSDAINVGQSVYAVGNPFGELVYTMTDGIISARDREVSVEGKIINTFQFSAAVNSGNSGGPIYDTNGEVIGIVTAKPVRNSVEGIGFAIPINDAIEIAAELIEFGYITGRPLMGITAGTVTRANAEYYGWDVAGGVYVKTISQDSAAEKAGIMVGDIITKLGESEVDSMESLRFTMRKYRAGDTITLMVWRSGEDIELTITFDEDLSAGQAR